MLVRMWNVKAIRLLATSLLAITVAVSFNAQSAQALLSGTWSWPLSGQRSVLRHYEAPERFYAPGHRGIDLPAVTGQEVVAPADGVVHFVGHVVNRDVISVQHGQYLSSFEPVSSGLKQGDLVERGQVIGTVSAGSHCECLHMGARKGENYLSPLALLATIPPAVLLPWDD